jgi:multicomponent Na+:H+ antiporter subunit B
MSARGRLCLFALAGPGLLAVLVIGLHGLPAFGDFHGAYGLLVDKLEPKLRHATDIVTALNFDVRAFDTLGEEFILFASVSGVALLLRHLREEDDGTGRSRGLDDHRFAGASDALRVLSLLLVPIILALGAYLAMHGQLTPGGGFQGGIVLASGPMAIFLSGGYLRLRLTTPHTLIELGDAIGAAGYGLVGLGGLVFTGIFFKNFLPFGIPGHLLSAGQMDLASVAVGFEVNGAFLVAWSEFLDQTILIRRDSE